MTFGQEADEQTAHGILDKFIDADGTLIDTADVYADGASEVIIGRWLARHPGLRDQLIIATKGRFPVTGQAQPGLRREYLHRALDASLKRLGVEQLDIYQAHGPDAAVPLDEFALFAAEAVASGKVAHIGHSNFTGWQTALLQSLCSRHGARPPVVVQPQYSLLVRETEWEILPAAMELGIGVMVWGPLGAGWLTGKYLRDQAPPPGSRLGDNPDRGLEALNRRGTERTWRIVDTVLDVARDHGLTPVQVALGWVLDRPGVTAALVGARTADQLSVALAAADVVLDPAAAALLTEVSQPSTPDYPYAFINEISTVH